MFLTRNFSSSIYTCNYIYPYMYNYSLSGLLKKYDRAIYSVFFHFSDKFVHTVK